MLILLKELRNKDIEQLMLIALEEEPDHKPHAWCHDWMIRAADYLINEGFQLRPTCYKKQYNLRAGQGAHLWIELACGTLLDGTVGQYCRDDIWILPPGHLARALYQYTGEQGEVVGTALNGPHPLVANFDATWCTSNSTRC